MKKLRERKCPKCGKIYNQNAATCILCTEPLPSLPTDVWKAVVPVITCLAGIATIAGLFINSATPQFEHPPQEFAERLEAIEGLIKMPDLEQLEGGYHYIFLSQTKILIY